jgi:hypothetical protein
MLEVIEHLESLGPLCTICDGNMPDPTLWYIDKESISAIWRCAVCGEADNGSAFVFGNGGVDFDLSPGGSTPDVAASLILLINKEEDQTDEATRLLWASRLSRELPEAYAGIEWADHI